MPPNTLRGGRTLAVALATALSLGTIALATAAPAQAATASDDIVGGSISWGLKSSFRTYVKGPVAHGSITTTAPATDDGTTTTFAKADGTWKADATTVTSSGAVTYFGHDGELNLTVTNPSIKVDATGATLVVDAKDSDGVTHDDLVVANLDISGRVTETDYSVKITAAPATLTAAGTALFSFGGTSFYSAGTALDPVSAELNLREPLSVTASKSSFGEDETATITVTGRGFYPTDSMATRPPLSGKPGGVYVAVGKFAEAWRPSAGAASAARKTSAVKWAVLAADITTVGGAAAGGIELKEDGTFSAELPVSKAALDQIAGLTAAHVNYGIYTYPGGGAIRADWERYIPITFTTKPAATSITLTAPTTGYGTAAKVTVEVSPAGTGKVSLSGAGPEQTADVSSGKATFLLPANLGIGSRTLTASYTGDANQAPATATVGHTVTKATVTSRFSKSRTPTSRKSGKGKVNVASLAGAKATGKAQVRFTKGSSTKSVTVKLSKGAKTFTIPKLKKGTWTVSVRYYGDATNAAQAHTAVASFKVNK